MKHKPIAIRRQRAIERKRRRAVKSAVKTNKKRANRAVHAFKVDAANHLARLAKLERMSVDLRVRYARKQMVAPVLLPTPPKRFLPTWQETMETKRRAA